MKGILVHTKTVILPDYFTLPTLGTCICSNFCYVGHYCTSGNQCPYVHVEGMNLPDRVLSNLSEWVDLTESNADWSRKYKLESIKNQLLNKRIDDVESDNNMDDENEFNQNFVSQVVRVQKELVDLINHNDNEDQLIPDADILLPHKVVKLKMKGFLVHITTDELPDYITTYPSGTRSCSNFCYVGHYCTRGKRCPYLHPEWQFDLPHTDLTEFCYWVDSTESNADWSRTYELESINNQLLHKRVDDVESDNNMDDENEFDQNYVCEKRQCGVCKLPVSGFDSEHECHHCDQHICYMCNKYSQCIKEFDEFIVPNKTMPEYRTQTICTNCLPEVWSENKMILNTIDRMRER